MEFKNRYSNLNAAQKQAVDTIDGPVMVIAGPGTGKTELLSVRSANILQKTDTLPENILCLTFTDSGAAAMRERLAGIIGKDAYKVAIHTFHSFGTEIINQNAEYFYQGAHFKAADELSTYEIIRSIFDDLDHNSPLSSTMNGEYTHLRDSLTVISELKKSGLTSDELLAILDCNDITIDTAERILLPIFIDRPSKKMLDPLTNSLILLRGIDDQPTIPSIVALSRIIADSLETAISQSRETDSTKPITAWRDSWFTKNEAKQFVLKSKHRQEKLRAVSYIYYQYLARMEAAGLYDFDDMILQVVHAIAVYDDLRFNLQEKYQYIMVDEFQDTNLAQMRILHSLTDNPVNEGRPNILVVGDDDQAIYSFQGADISNIIDFRLTYPKFVRIALTDNYRSSSAILQYARDIITQGQGRLENIMEDLSKQLTAHSKYPDSSTLLYEAATNSDERHWLAASVADDIKKGTSAGDIAILTRRHGDIKALLPYLQQAGISVNYERRDSVLDQPLIILIEQLASVITNIAEGNHDLVNSLLPKLLAHPAWAITAIDLWKLSTKAYDQRVRWLELMGTTLAFVDIHTWLITLATHSPYWSLEHILDEIIGKDQPTEGYRSPLYKYFFSSKVLTETPDDYIMYLEALRTIRTKLKEYQPQSVPTLESFLSYVALHRQLGTTITSLHRVISSDNNAVTLMTAHKAKGLEFDTVYVTGAVDTVWGEGARTHSRTISYPENLPLAPAGETSDERLRLFYVAATRAKHQLRISYSLQNDSGKRTLRAGFLLSDIWQSNKIELGHDGLLAIADAEIRWYEPLITPTHSLKAILAPALESYKLSATHLNSFIDITRGGPQNFLIQNLLHFPSAMSPQAAYGSAIHKTLQTTHTHLSVHKHQKPVEDILQDFEENLIEKRLESHDFNLYLKKGSDELQTFLASTYDSFSPDQKVELSFSHQGVIVGEAKLSGSLDLIDIDKANKTITVTDYKTGRPVRSWHGKDDAEKIKLHKYKQQLIFYALLIANSRDYNTYQTERGVLQFIQPTSGGDIIILDTYFTSDELNRCIQLINAAWTHIINLNLPDTSSYEQNLKGILAFEQDLIDGTV